MKGTAPRNAGVVIAALGELIEALDRRVPNMERIGEVRVLRQAAELRAEAVARIHELTHGDEGL